MPLGFTDFTEPLTASERASMKAEKAEWDDAIQRARSLAIDDAKAVVAEYISDCDCCKDSFESRRFEQIISRLEALKEAKP